MGGYGVEIQSRFIKKFVQPVEKGEELDFKMVSSLCPEHILSKNQA
jgi:hypothetical protein